MTCIFLKQTKVDLVFPGQPHLHCKILLYYKFKSPYNSREIGYRLFFFFKERTYLFTTWFKSPERINHRRDRQMAYFYISQRRLFGVIMSKERAVLVPLLGSMPLGLWNEMNRLHTSRPTTDWHFSMPKLRHAASFYSDPPQKPRWRFDGWVSQETKQSVTSQF